MSEWHDKREVFSYYGMCSCPSYCLCSPEECLIEDLDEDFIAYLRGLETKVEAQRKALKAADEAIDCDCARCDPSDDNTWSGGTPPCEEYRRLLEACR